MYDCFGTGFAGYKLIFSTVAIYAFLLGLPLAITYVTTGLKEHFSKQIKLVTLCTITLLGGGFFVYDPEISSITAAFIALNFGISIHAVIVRNKAERGL
jgi:hypothetical protein